MNTISDSMSQQSQINEKVSVEAGEVIKSDREIKKSIDEQQQGIQDIVMAIKKIIETIQDNASALEEIAGNVESLKDMAVALDRRVDYFQI